MSLRQSRRITKVYLNGVEKASTLASGAISTNSDPFIIGKLYNAYANFLFDGLIDDVRIYNRALSAGEIAALAAGNHTTAIWDGSSSTDWETSANWDINAVPDPFTHVIVRDTTNDPKLTASVSGASLTIEASSSLDLASFNFELNDGGALKGGGTLKLKGNEVLSNLSNLATTSTGIVLYYGTGSFTGLAAGDNYNNLTINDGLVGYWPFDNGSGLSATDKSGHGNNGTLTGGPTWSATPTNNISFTNPYAMSFDGTDDYVNILDNAALDPTSQLSVSFWMKQSASARNKALVTKWDHGVSTSWGIETESNDVIQMHIAEAPSGGGGRYAYSANGAVIPGNWHHVMFIYEGSGATDSDRLKLYVNGAPRSLTFAGAIASSLQNSTSPVRIGEFGGLSRYFNGDIDDVRIYSRALSAAEIAALAAGNQPSLKLGTFTLDAALDVNGDLVLNGGTLDTSSGNYGVTVGGSWENNGGVFTPRKGTVTLDGTTAGLEILSGGQRFDKLTINGAGSTYTLADRLTASGALTLSNGTLDVSSTGNFTVKAGTISQTSGTFTARSGLVVLTSPADQTATITSTLNTLRIEDPTENGLVGYWKFDEGTNSGAILDSAGGNTGVRRGGAGRIWTGSTLYTPSAIQFDNPYAMTFDGVDDYVDLGSKTFSTNAISISTWVKLDTLETSEPFIASDGGLWSLGNSQPAGKARFLIYAGANHVVDSVTSLPTGAWTHVVGTWEQSEGIMRIYMDGVLDNSTSGVTNAKTFDGTIYIARNSTLYMDGLLDDVRIYNRALSANEIANLARGRYASGNSSTSTFTLGGNLSVATLALDSGNLSTSNRTLTVTNALNILRGGGNLTLGSALASLNGGLTLSGSTITGGAGTLDVNGSLAMSTGSLIAPSGTMTISGNFTMSGGILDSNGGTITFDGSSDQGLRMPGTSSTADFSTLRINKSAGSLILGSAISGALLQLSQSTFSPGSTVVTAQATTIDGGTLTRGAANYNSRILTLSSGTYNANGRQSIWSGAVLLSGGTYTASSATQTFGSSLTISGGTYTGSTGTADINGNFTLNSGTFTAPSITLLSGNFTNVAGTFTQGSNLFTLDGNAQTLSGSLTFYDLTKTVSSGTTLFFHAGNTVTVTNTLTLQGAANNTLKLRSTTSATQWKIDPQVTRTLSYIDVQDSWNMNATAIDCIGLNCTDSGNNTNWTFVAAASTGGTGNNRTRQRNTEAASGGGGGGGGSVSTGTGATPFVFVPNYAPLATRLTEAQRKAREGSLALPTETARRILEIREALITRFEGIREESDRLIAEEEDRDQELAEKREADRFTLAEKQREDRIASRIDAYRTEIARLEEERKDLAAQYEERREERLAQAIALKKQEMLAKEVALQKEQEALQKEQEENRKEREQRIAAQQETKNAVAQRKPVAVTTEAVALRRNRLFLVVDASPVLYRDVPLDAWYAPYVAYVIEENIATGYADAAGKLKGEFGVENPVTYAEILKMAYEAAGKDLPGGVPRNNSAKGSWASAYVKLAEDDHLAVFAPALDVNTPATRGAVIQTILEVMGFPITKTLSTYSDVPTNHPYSAAIALATFAGFVTGDMSPDGALLNRFRPDDSINRAEVSKIIALVKEVMK